MAAPLGQGQRRACLTSPNAAHVITYLALATVAGDFAAPPTRAEEMHAPETFGRAASERGIVHQR